MSNSKLKEARRKLREEKKRLREEKYKHTPIPSIPDKQEPIPVKPLSPSSPTFTPSNSLTERQEDSFKPVEKKSSIQYVKKEKEEKKEEDFFDPEVFRSKRRILSSDDFRRSQSFRFPFVQVITAFIGIGIVIMVGIVVIGAVQESLYGTTGVETGSTMNNVTTGLEGTGSSIFGGFGFVGFIIMIMMVLFFINFVGRDIF